MMGSALGTCEEVVDELLIRRKVGVLKVRLFRPFSAKHLLQALPETVRAIAVLDRTKEPGAQAEPLYLDVMTALAEAFNNGERETLPRTIGGRYGLSSKSSARRAYWRSLMNSAVRNPSHGLRWAFMMTLLTSRCHYRKIPCPAALNLKRYFTVWEATAAYPPRKII